MKQFSYLFILFGLPLFLLMACNLSPKETGSGNTSSVQTLQLPSKIDFNFHIKPILSDRCFKCHGPDKNSVEADLAFHDEALAFAALGKNKDRYAIVPGNIEQSTLLTRIFSTDANELMPPPTSNLILTNYEKELLKQWVAEGAEWKEHWALLPPTTAAVPQAKSDWGNNEIDQFILAKLKEQGFEPAAPANKEKLLRRVSFDLTGLPPKLAELDAFLADDSPQAFEKVVDALLAKQSYGERMAIEWMDLARYADTHGYQDDFERTMWPWRDWVIHAFNKNLPYDQFVQWQLAGDLLDNPSKEQIVATAFNRNHKITFEGGAIDEEYRVEYVADRAQTFSTAFLGLTMECARCHDHKYDPLSQENYFQLFSFFNNVPEKGFMDKIGQTPKPYLEITEEDIAKTLTFINNVDDLPTIPLMVMSEQKNKRQAHILNRGLYDQPTKKVEPATPESILPFSNYKKDRLGLSEWLFADENPLTARVAVNRLWQQLFGTGIVATPFDFGNQGSLPSHPELLDFLALKFKNDNWDVKSILKYMLLSATYQQSAVASEVALQNDPENRWLSHASHLRLKSEMIRDQALAIAELLNEEVGGPSVKPYQPEGLWAETTGGGGGSTAKYVQDEGDNLFRKSLYTFWKRTVPPPNMMTLDASSRDLCTVQRQETNTPLQALVLLNDPQFIEAAKILALQALDKSEQSMTARITYLFRKASSRLPDTAELEILEKYLNEELIKFKRSPDLAAAYLQVGNYKYKTEVEESEFAAYTMVANAILNLDEVISRG